MKSSLLFGLLFRRTLAQRALLITAATLGGCAHGAKATPSTPPQAAQKGEAHDAFRAHPPEGEAPAPLELPLPTVRRLENGMALWTAPKSNLPLVSVTAVIKSGSAQDPRGLEGLASLTAEVMRMGTRSRSAQAIALAVENVGGSLDVSAEDDAIYVQASAMTANIGPVLDVMADILQTATFERAEVERAREQRLADLMQLQNEPVSIGNTVFRRVVYGQHAYGHATWGTSQSVRALRQRDLLRFYKDHVHAANTALIVVGDLTEAEAEQAITSRFGAWTTRRTTQAAPVQAIAHPTELTVVDKPGAPQSRVVVGGVGVTRDDPDYFSLLLGNAVLGGQFNSRLNMNLREDKGWTYGARSSFVCLRAPGPFSIASSVHTEATAPAIREMFKEVERMRESTVSAAELEAARNGFTLSLPDHFQSLSGIGHMLSTLALYDLPPTYYRELPQKLAAVTPASVREALHRHLDPRALSVVVVGDKQVVMPTLSDLHLGAPRLRDAEGRLTNGPGAPAQHP